jgi:riboflavin synthase
MFTGLIEQTGSVVEIASGQGAQRITIEAPGLASRLHEGDSVAVSGVCLTALEIGGDRFHADLAQETIERTSLIRLQPGTLVNLELPTPAGTPLGGHVVQGHVDATGELMALTAVSPEATAQTDWLLKIKVPESVAPYLVEKGSIAIEGISLTIARWDRAASMVTIAIIPHTYARTNLHALRAGDPVNLEADVMMKLAVERFRSAEGSVSTLTVDFLVASGY